VTGQVNYLAGYLVGRQQVSAFYAQLDRTYPAADLLYVICKNRYSICRTCQMTPGLPHQPINLFLPRYQRGKT
jgi:hypothetical protein